MASTDRPKVGSARAARVVRRVSPTRSGRNRLPFARVGPSRLPTPRYHVNHDTILVGTIATGIGVAFVFGLLAARIGLPPLIGYLVAGIVVGPFTPGYVADAGLAGQLAELGVTLLMFGVGLHLSLSDFARCPRPGQNRDSPAMIDVATMAHRSASRVRSAS